jgi:hypothetical protein
MSKKLQTLLASLIFFTSTGIAQTFYTVDNRPGLPANYHTLQGALDSVPSGSILLLQGSGIHYGFGDVKKPVAIFGAGYFLGQNPAPSTQAKLNQSMVAQLFFHKGAQGSIVSGVSFVQNSSYGGIAQRIICDSASDITISRCYFEYIPFDGFTRTRIFLFQNSSSIAINQCYISVAETVMVPIKSSGIIFSNNIFVGSGITSMIISAQSPFNYSFNNNSFSATMQSIDFSGGSFSNNVIIQNNTGITVTVSGVMVFADHNVSNVNIFPAGGTNINNADGSNTYVGTSNPAITSADGIWQLKPGSVAIGYATNGSDCGAYGGTKSYVLSGIPAIPNFYFADAQQSATGTGGLNIHFKIKANQ